MGDNPEGLNKADSKTSLFANRELGGDEGENREEEKDGWLDVEKRRFEETQEQSMERQEKTHKEVLYYK